MRKDIPLSEEVREALGAAAELARIQLGKCGEGFCRKGKIRQLERDRQTDRGAERGREKWGAEKKFCRKVGEETKGWGSWKWHMEGLNICCLWSSADLGFLCTTGEDRCRHEHRRGELAKSNYAIKIILLGILLA